MDPSPLHDRLRAAVGAKTYRQISDLTGTNAETTRRYMQGQPPSVEFLAALAAGLSLNAEWLLTGRGPMHRGEVRAHALQEANAHELLHAVADTLERLLTRVERLEVFLQTLELRLRARTPVPSDHGGQEAGVPVPQISRDISRDIARASTRDGAGNTAQPVAQPIAQHIADALPQ